MRGALAVLSMVGLAVVLAGAVSGVAAQGEAGTSPAAENVTVDGAVAEATGTVEILVELSGAGGATGVEGLQAHAAETQAPLVGMAERHDGLRVERQFWLTNAVLVTVDTGQVSLDTLASVEGVEALRENGRVTVDTGTPRGGPVQTASGSGHLADGSGTTLSGSTVSAGVSTENYDTTYGLAQINATAVWDTYGTQGGGTSVAVLDTGVDADHPDIDLTEWVEFDSEGDPVDSSPKDYSGHGTHVSGTVAGGAASGTHVGVAPATELYHAAVLTDCGESCTGTFAQIIAGMEWAVNESVDVMSMSLGANGYEDAFIDPVRNAQDAGVTVVAAIGNAGEGNSSSPGNVYDAISVGASDEAADITGFSSGEPIDTLSAWGADAPLDWPSEYTVPSVAAPGANVKSTYLDGSYERLFGTSMATPHVAGAVALLSSIAADNVTPAEFGAALEETAWKPADASEPAGQRDSRYGAGIIDVPAAAESLPLATPLGLAGIDAPAEVAPTENLTVGYSIENTGDEANTESAVRLLVEGTGQTPDDADRNVTVAAGETVNGTLTFDGVDEQFDHGDTVAFTVELADTGDSANGTTDVVADPPEFTVGIVEAGDVLAGEDLPVTAAIENVGDREGTQTVTLSIPGLGDNATSVTLDTDESVEETLTVGTDQGDAGEYNATVTSDNDTAGTAVVVEQPQPATGAVSGLEIAGRDTPTRVAEGEEANVSAVVENTGDESGSFEVTLEVGTAVERTASTAELSSGATETVRFENVTGELADGSYNVTVSTPDDSVTGELTVNSGPTMAFPDQNLSDTAAAAAESVASDGEVLLLVTYETDGETVVAGVTNGTFDTESVPVELVEHVGVPDTYTAHLLSAANASGSYQPGDTLSAETADAVLVSESARVTTVTGAPDIAVGDAPAKDTNLDGRLNDIDGDGEFTIFDVQAFFTGFQGDTVQSAAEYFNFDGGDPAEVTIFDVQALFIQLAS